MGHLIPAYFNWSGGKDSALALYKTLHNQEFDIRYLLTSFNEETDRISMHGVRSSLLDKQAGALGIPIKKVLLPTEADMAIYESKMSEAINELKSEGIADCIFGDIFLEDLRLYREQNLQKVAVSAHFPLWKRNTRELMLEFIDLGFKTIVVCVDASKLSEEFAGRIIDRQFLEDLPKNVDPCGENGEFHTFVFDGPCFSHPVEFRLGEKVFKTYHQESASGQEYGFWFQDML